MFSGLAKLSIRNTFAVVILCLLVLVGGVTSSKNIRIQTYPDVSLPSLFIQVSYPGASSEDVEKDISKPIEDSLMSNKNYDSVTSTSSENSASIFMSYSYGTDMDKATTDVDAALQKIQLPTGATYKISRLTMNSQPIYEAALYSKEQGLKLQETLEDDVIPKIEKVAGVDSVTLKGEKTEKLQIVVDKEKAEKNGISLSTIQAAVQGSEFAVPLGTVQPNGQTISLRLTGDIKNINQLKDLKLFPGGQSGQQTGRKSSQQPMAQGQRGQTMSSQSGSSVQQGSMTAQMNVASPVRLGDIATVKMVTSEDEITRYNGKPTLLLQVTKSQDANTADVGNNVKSILKTVTAKYPMGIHTMSDQGKEIQDSVSTLIREGLLGALFTVIVILLFLRNIRATIISILSLPISIFTTIMVLDQMDYTLNIMTLGGIVVAIGRIVDDSIVVIENIYRWKHKNGTEYKAKELALYATKEVIGAVASSTFATVVVFLPLAFVGGIIGQFFRPFAVSVVVSIFTSLLVAMILIPALGAKFFKKDIKPHIQEGRFIKWYEKLLRGALQRKALVIVLSIVLLGGSFAIIPTLGVSFLPGQTIVSMKADITLPPASTLDEADVVAKSVEKYFENIKGVKQVQTTIGEAGGRRMISMANKNRATVEVTFRSNTNVDSILTKSSKDLPILVNKKIDGTIIKVSQAEGEGPPSGNSIDVSLYSSNYNDLATAASLVEKNLSSNNQLKNVSNNLKESQPKWDITLTDKSKDDQVSMNQVMNAINENIKANDIGKYSINGVDQTLSVGYDKEATTKADIENIKIVTQNGVKVLKDYISIQSKEAPVSISHDDGKQYAKVSGEIKGTDTKKVTASVETELKKIHLPESVELKTGGGMQMISSGFSDLGIAIAIAVGLVFLIMSMTFGGILTPLVIMASLIFIPIGALTGLLIAGQPLSMSAMIGLLMLIGIVVTNAVVLLDRVERNRRDGNDIVHSVIEAAKTRIRPIVMTALATILALTPMAVSDASAGLISKGLAVTVIGGLTTSTMLTLIVIPVLYSIVGKYRRIEK